MKFVYFKGKIVEEEHARVPLSTHALQYGTGVFDSVRGYWHENEKRIYLLKAREHFDRLLDSAKIIGWKMDMQSDEMVEILRELVRKNNPSTDIYVRPFIFQASEKLGPTISDALEPTFAMYMIPLGDYLSTEKGLKGKVVSWTRVDDSMIPLRAKVTGLYINSALARREAEEYGADEAIFLNRNGSVSEGSGENIFIVRKGAIITPPVSSNIVEGITRGCVIQIAHDEGIPVFEREIDRTELYIAGEVFLTGTACQVTYFSKIDGRIIGNGGIGHVTAALQKRYFAAVRKQDERYSNWLVPV